MCNTRAENVLFTEKEILTLDKVLIHEQIHLKKTNDHTL